MKSMGSASEFYNPPPKGKYLATITATESGHSKKGETQIKVTAELAEGPGKGESADKYLGTDGTTRYGSMSKANLRGLGLPVDSDAEISDDQICQRLLGQKVYVEIDHEQLMEKDEKGEYTKPSFVFDARTGQNAPRLRWVIKGFQQVNTGAQIAHAPQAQAQAPQGQYAQAPQGYPQVPAQGAPAGWNGAAPNFPAGFVPQQPQGFAPPQGAPAGFVPAQPQFAAPPGFAPGQVAQPGWAQGPQQGPAAPAEEQGGKKKRKMNVTDAE